MKAKSRTLAVSVLAVLLALRAALGGDDAAADAAGRGGAEDGIAVERLFGPEIPGKYKHPASFSELSESRSSEAARTARRASSSCTVGTPKTAMTASPMNFSTVPPWRSRQLLAVSK